MSTAPSAPRERDAALVLRAARGDRAAQKAVFLAEREGVHHVLFRIFGTNRGLEDLIATTFQRIFELLVLAPPAALEGGELARWCQTIATRVARETLCRRTAPTLAIVETETQQLYAALDRIDVDLRIAFALVAIDGRSSAEVAALTSSTSLGIRTRVWRARKGLAHLASTEGRAA